MEVYDTFGFMRRGELCVYESAGADNLTKRRWQMLIFGHPWIESSRFVKVFSIDEIKKTEPGDVLLLEPLSESIEIVNYCRKNSLIYAVTVGALKDALFANELHAAYVVCQLENAIEIQKIAQEYLFDTKVLVLIEDEKEIETLARFGIDGVMFPATIEQM
jgi:hypothetical protein